MGHGPLEPALCLAVRSIPGFLQGFLSPGHVGTAALLQSQESGAATLVKISTDLKDAKSTPGLTHTAKPFQALPVSSLDWF